LTRLLKIIAPFSVLYVTEDSLFGPAIDAPFWAKNIAVMRKEQEYTCGGKKKLLAARNCEIKVRVKRHMSLNMRFV
jgi:hypothetical protein